SSRGGRFRCGGNRSTPHPAPAAHIRRTPRSCPSGPPHCAGHDAACGVLPFVVEASVALVSAALDCLLLLHRDRRVCRPAGNGRLRLWCFGCRTSDRGDWLRHLNLYDAAVRADPTFGQDVALVDPALHTNPPERRMRLRKAVVDIRSECVARDPALGVGFFFNDSAPTEAPGNSHADTERAPLHRPLHSLLDGAAKSDAALQLVGHGT